MARRTHELEPPRGLIRLLYRAPIALFRVGLGPAFGRRLLLLHHVGARTGRARRAVLEVIGHDASADTYYVGVGYGDRTQWVRNLEKNPEARIEVGWRKLSVRARLLDSEEAGTVLVDYARRHALFARFVLWLFGYDVDGSEGDYREAARLGLHVVAFEREPRDREHS